MFKKLFSRYSKTLTKSVITHSNSINSLQGDENEVQEDHSSNRNKPPADVMFLVGMLVDP